MAKTTTCQKCGDHGVYWKLTRSGKSRYLHDTNTNQPHYITCAYATEQEKANAEEVKLEEKTGYSRSIDLSASPVAKGISEEKFSDELAKITESLNQQITIEDYRYRNQLDENKQLVSRIQLLTLELAEVRAIKEQARTIEVKLPSGKTIDVGRQHKEFERLVAYIAAGLNVFCAGPAGSGKTEGAKQVAKALGLDLYEQPLNPMLSDSKLTGFMSANGIYIPTAARNAYEFGGLLVLDEGDNANPSLLAGMNALLSNGSYGFPDKRVEKHKDFRVILTANTWGYGADRQYVARNQLDAATLNRFVFLPWDYDEAFELELAGNAEWTRYVQKVRQIVFQHKIRVVVGPRQSIFGATLLSIGRPREEVEQAVLWAPMNAEDKEKIRASLRYS